MSDELFKSWVEQVNRPMRTEERVCVIDEAYTAITVKEEVIRCRDCKHFTRNATPHDAAFPDWCSKLGTDYVQPDGFCAWGERKG
jgi:hypothetical protein